MGTPHFPKLQASPSDGLVSYQGHLLGVEGVLLLCRDAVRVFYSPNSLGYNLICFQDVTPHHFYCKEVFPKEDILNIQNKVSIKHKHFLLSFLDRMYIIFLLVNMYSWPCQRNENTLTSSCTER